MADHARKVDRPWSDVSPKVVAGVLGGVTSSGIVWAGSLMGWHVDPGLAVLLATLVGGVAAYWKRDTRPSA